MAIAINPDVRELDFSDNVKVSKFMQDFSDFRMKKWVTYRPVNAPSPAAPFAGGTRQFIINMGTGHIIDTQYSGLWFTIQFTNLSQHLIWPITASLPRTSAAWIESVTFQHSNVPAHIDERLADYDAIHSFFTPGKDVRSMKQTFFLNERGFTDNSPYNLIEEDDTFAKLLPAGITTTRRISTVEFSFFIPLNRLSTIFNSGRYFFPSLLRGNGEMTLSIRSVHNTLSEIFGGDKSSCAVFSGHRSTDFIWQTEPGAGVDWACTMTNMKLITLNLDNAFLTKEYNAFIAGGRKFIRSFKAYNYQYFEVKEGYNRIEIANTHQSISHIVLAFQAPYTVRVNGRPTGSLGNQILGLSRVPAANWADEELLDANGEPIEGPELTPVPIVGTQTASNTRTTTMMPRNTGRIQVSGHEPTGETTVARLERSQGTSLSIPADQQKQGVIMRASQVLNDTLRATMGVDVRTFLANSMILTGTNMSGNYPVAGPLLAATGHALSMFAGPPVPQEHLALAQSSTLASTRAAAEALARADTTSYDISDESVHALLKIIEEQNPSLKSLLNNSKYTRKASFINHLVGLLRVTNRRNSVAAKQFVQKYSEIATLNDLTEAQKIYLAYQLQINPSDETPALKYLYDVLEVADAQAAQADPAKKPTYDKVMQVIAQFKNQTASIDPVTFLLGRAGEKEVLFKDVVDLAKRCLDILKTDDNDLSNPATDMRIYEIIDDEVNVWHRHHHHMVPAEAKQTYDMGMHVVDKLQVYRGTGNGETVFSEPIDGEMFYHVSREALGESAEDHPFFGFESFRKDGAVIVISLNTFMRDAPHEFWDGFSTNRVADRLYVEFNATSFSINEAAEITPWYMRLGYNGIPDKLVCKVFTMYDNIYYIDRNNNLNVSDTLIPLQEGRAPASE